MNNFTGHEIPQRFPSIMSRKTPTGVALINLEQDQQLYNLTGYCIEIWNTIDGKRTILEIAKHSFEACHVPAKHRERFETDLSGFLKELAELKLIHL